MAKIKDIPIDKINAKISQVSRFKCRLSVKAVGNYSLIDYPNIHRSSDVQLNSFLEFTTETRIDSEEPVIPGQTRKIHKWPFKAEYKFTQSEIHFRRQYHENELYSAEDEDYSGKGAETVKGEIEFSYIPDLSFPPYLHIAIETKELDKLTVTYHLKEYGIIYDVPGELTETMPHSFMFEKIVEDYGVISSMTVPLLSTDFSILIRWSELVKKYLPFDMEIALTDKDTLPTESNDEIVVEIIDEASKKPVTGIVVLVEYEGGAKKEHLVDKEGKLRLRCTEGQEYKILEITCDPQKYQPEYRQTNFK